MIYNKKNKEYYLNEFLDRLKKEIPDLDVTNNANLSFINSLLEANEDFSSFLSDFYNEYNLEKRTGESLDNLMNFLGFYRYRNTKNSNYKIDILCNFDNYEKLIIPQGSIFEINDIKYITKRNKQLTNINSSLTIELLESSSSTIVNKLNFENYAIDINNLSYFYKGKKQSENELKNSLLSDIEIINFSEMKDEIESDQDFLNRAKNLMQLWGAVNRIKISNLLKSIPNIAEVNLVEYSNYLEIYILPVKLENYEDTIKQAKEIINYLDIKNIKIKRPYIINFKINNLENIITRNLNEKAFKEITRSIKDYINNLHLKNNIFNREYLEDLIYNIGIKYDELFILKEKEIEIIYEIIKNEKVIIKNKINMNEIRKFNNSIFSVNIN